MRIVFGISIVIFAVLGLIQTIAAMRSNDDIYQIKMQLHSIKSLGFMILFYLMFKAI